LREPLPILGPVSRAAVVTHDSRDHRIGGSPDQCSAASDVWKLFTMVVAVGRESTGQGGVRATPTPTFSLRRCLLWMGCPHPVPPHTSRFKNRGEPDAARHSSSSLGHISELFVGQQQDRVAATSANSGTRRDFSDPRACSIRRSSRLLSRGQGSPRPTHDERFVGATDFFFFLSFFFTRPSMQNKSF